MNYHKVSELSILSIYQHFGYVVATGWYLELEGFVAIEYAVSIRYRSRICCGLRFSLFLLPFMMAH
jgi:hypothetical protein